jgi:hypothetical protein
LIFQMLVFIAAGWLRRSDLLIIDYLREENRVLREQLQGRRLSFSDEQASAARCPGSAAWSQRAGSARDRRHA